MVKRVRDIQHSPDSYRDQYLKLKIRLAFVFLISLLVACGERNDVALENVSPEAKRLNDSAVVLFQSTQNFKNDSLSCAKAIALLDQAVAIDSNYYIAYCNKIMFEWQNKQFDKALKTSKEISRLSPYFPEYFDRTGILCEITGDSISAMNYYRKANALYISILDTMQPGANYDMKMMSKGVNLILLGDEKAGQDLILQTYVKQTFAPMKDAISPFVNKNRQEILAVFRENKMGK